LVEAMKNTKHQTPNTKESANSKPQTSRVNYLEHGADVGGPVTLRDEPPKQNSSQHPFDMEERTAVFGENVVRFSRKVPRDPSNNRLIDQVVGAGTSVAANFCEANDCFSKKDFRYTVKRCMKEAKETRLFLRMIATSEPQLAEEARPLYREATELLRILATMYRK
jgi:four helix bundle protein